MKIALRTFGLIGFILFGSLYLLTFNQPAYIENVAKTFIKNKVEEKTIEKIDNIGETTKNNKLVKLAGRLLKNQKIDIEKLREKIKHKAGHGRQYCQHGLRQFRRR